VIRTHSPTALPPSFRSTGVTLIELLVVIAIIGLLISILLPTLSHVRDNARLVTCAANLGQIGIALIAYADEHTGPIPRGPARNGPYDFSCEEVATNQLWIGDANPLHSRGYTGIGLLLDWHSTPARLLYCPADDTRNQEEELPRIGTDLDAYGSYTYRQLDQVPAPYAAGKLTELGANVIGNISVPVEALAFDTNSLGPGPYRHTNHKAASVNVLFRDGSARSFSNRRGVFSIPPESFQSPTQILERLDQILINADYGYSHAPQDAPKIGASE